MPTLYIFLIILIIFLSVFLDILSDKIGIPALLAFILLGMFFGSDGLFGLSFENYEMVELICSYALIFIMFYGGFGTNIKEARPVAKKAVLLSTIGVALTAVLTAIFCFFVLNCSFIECLLIGSVISSTDAASVFSILRSKKLSLKYNTASLLELESGSNDPMAYMLTMICIIAVNGYISGGGIIIMIIKQFAYGILFGLIIAYLAKKIMKLLDFKSEGYDAIFMIAVALISYVAPNYFGGNGYLSTYIVGIILGNSKIVNKKTLVPFFDGITGLMQICIFFLLGLISFPSRLPGIAITALLIAIFLTFVARPVAVFSILGAMKSPWKQSAVVSIAGLRGAASIVFAVMAINNISLAYDMFHIVFFIVLFSIAIQGSLLPVISKKMDMIDENYDIMKTFSDYSKEAPIQFINLKVSKGYPWCNKKVKDIVIPPDTLISLIKRGNKNFSPNGETTILENDILYLLTKKPKDIDKIQLIEEEITFDSPMKGLPLHKAMGDRDELVMMIMRDDKTLIPNGDTIINEGDVLVMSDRNC